MCWPCCSQPKRRRRDENLLSIKALSFHRIIERRSNFQVQSAGCPVTSSSMAMTSFPGRSGKELFRFSAFPLPLSLTRYQAKGLSLSMDPDIIRNQTGFRVVFLPRLGEGSSEASSLLRCHRVSVFQDIPEGVGDFH